MIAGRELKAVVDGAKSVSKPEPEVKPVGAFAPAPSVSAPKPSSVKPTATDPFDHTPGAPANPIPKTGRKVEVKPASK